MKMICPKAKECEIDCQVKLPHEETKACSLPVFDGCLTCVPVPDQLAKGSLRQPTDKITVSDITAGGIEFMPTDRPDLMDYPKHKHPHGINDTVPDAERIWVCTECGYVFNDTEIREDTGWGHACKQHPCRKGQRCESHLEPYIPELNQLSKMVGNRERIAEIIRKTFGFAVYDKTGMKKINALTTEILSTLRTEEEVKAEQAQEILQKIESLRLFVLHER